MTAPANDNWIDAELISGTSGSLSASNVDATVQGSEPIASAGPSSAHRTIWYKWVAPAGVGLAAFSTQGSTRGGGTTTLDTVVGVYTGASLAGLVEITSNDDHGPFTGLDNFNSRVAFAVTPGTTYYLQIGGFSDTEQGDVALAWTTHPATSTDPASVRFHDVDAVHLVGTVYRYNTGRISVEFPAVDPADWPTTTDGFVNELDLVVEDPDDPDYVWGVYLYTDTDASVTEATVRAGFSFDSATPTIWDGWGAVKVLKSAYNADWSIYPYISYYDGAWGGSFFVGVTSFLDPVSIDGWNEPPPLPQHITPVITVPTTGQVFDLRFQGFISFSFNSADAYDHAQYQVLRAGSVIYDSGDFGVSISPFASSIAFSYPDSADEFRVRVRDADVSEWSDWASVEFVMYSPVDTPLDCFEDEVMADSPEVFWLSRDDASVGDVSSIADLSGNGRDGYFENAFILYFDAAAGYTGGPSSNDGFLSIPFAAVPDAGVSVAFIIFTTTGVAGGSLDFSANYEVLDESHQTGRDSYLLRKVLSDGLDSFVFYTGTLGDWAAQWSVVFDADYESFGRDDVTGPTDTFSITAPAWSGHRRELVMVAWSAGSDAWGITPTGYMNPGSNNLSVNGSRADTATGFAENFDWIPHNYTFTDPFSSTAGPITAWTIIIKGFDPPSPYPELGMSGTCDTECEDVNGGIRFWGKHGIFGGSVRWEDDGLFSSITDLTYEMVVRSGSLGEISFGANNPGSFFSEGLVVRAIADPLGYLYGGSLEYQHLRLGCWVHVAWVYTQDPVTGFWRQRLFMNGSPVASTSSTIDFSTLSGGVLGLQSGTAPGSLPGQYSHVTAAAVYLEALPINRIRAHAAHVCPQCGQFTPPLRIGQRSGPDGGLRVLGRDRSVQGSQGLRIHGPGSFA